MEKLKNKFVIFISVLLFLSLFTANVSAAPKEDQPLEAVVVDLPGPLAYESMIPNHLLPQIIESRDKKALVLNWYSWGVTLFRAPIGPAMSFTNSGAGLIAGSPTEKLKEAYYSGKDVYYGGYYPTPEPGLTTVPFIYYTNSRLTYTYNGVPQ
ncbi:hypothetical protein [Planococcus plakortidis]|uniref:hypothetical protein n=1 Tax=Planococcus plakortidis TaxID=1038856 RepID=UPI0038590699